MLIILSLLHRYRRLQPYDALRAKHRRGVVRVFALGLGVSAGVGTCAAHASAEARINESSMAIGQELQQLGDLLTDHHDIRLNGETIHVSAASTSQPYETVLDRFEAHCREHASASGAWWESFQRDLEKSGRLPEELAGKSSPLSVFRRESNGKGLVVCLAEPDSGPKHFFDAAREFVASRDLGKLGKLRYAYASRTEGGTSIVTAWTDGKFSLDSIVPPDGTEAPGSDSLLAPRPPDSMRLLSAELEDTAYGVRVYQSNAGQEQVFGYYDQEMKRRGWVVLTNESTKSTARGYLKDGMLVAVGADRDPNGGTVVSLGDLGAAHDVR